MCDVILKATVVNNNFCFILLALEIKIHPEAAAGGVLWKRVFSKFLQNSQEKGDSGTGAFLWILRNL